MRLWKRIGLILLVVMLIFAGYTVVSSGYFRTIEPLLDGRILADIPLKGAEDLTISQADSFVLISATDREVFPPTIEENGGLYWLDLRTNTFAPISLTDDLPFVFAPHGISMYPTDSGYQVMAINHTLEGHSIEVFELYDQTLTHTKTLNHITMIRPNDVVIVDENRFYFTNDHGYPEGLGKIFEEYSGLGLSTVVYFDGSTYQIVADGIAYANGINIDRDRNLLYVASPRHFKVKVYEIQADGSLIFVEDIPCGTGVDNIEFDEDGHLWIGAHPNLLVFNAYAKGKRAFAPSEVIKIMYRGKGDYSVEKIYVEDGQTLSASTVAAPFGNYVLVGSVIDEEVLVLELNER